MSSHPQFVGIEVLKQKQAETLAEFEKRVAAGNFAAIHRDHYDWWMFPIDEKSGYGYKWSLTEHDIQQLKSDSLWMESYLRGVELLFLSYGWCLKEKKAVSSPSKGQAWQNYPVRIFKCIKSLWLFGQSDALESARLYIENLGFGPSKPVDTNVDDGKRIIRLLKLSGYENIPEPPPRYR